MLSHHMVIRDGKIANYHPYPPTPWNASPTDSYGTAGPYEDAVQDQPIFEENDLDHFKGIDVMRTVRTSIRACRAAYTCISAGARSSRCCTRRPSRSPVSTQPQSGLDQLSETGERIDSLLSALGHSARWPNSAARTWLRW